MKLPYADNGGLAGISGNSHLLSQMFPNGCYRRIDIFTVGERDVGLQIVTVGI